MSITLQYIYIMFLFLANVVFYFGIFGIGFVLIADYFIQKKFEKKNKMKYNYFKK